MIVPRTSPPKISKKIAKAQPARPLSVTLRVGVRRRGPGTEDLRAEAGAELRRRRREGPARDLPPKQDSARENARILQL